MKTAIVFGATGLVGSNLVSLLTQSDKYEKIIVISRREAGFIHPQVETRVVDLTEDEALERNMQGDIVFCCLGTTIKQAGSKEKFRYVDHHLPVKIAQVTHKKKIPKMVVVSSVGADAQSGNFYLRTKGEMEKDVLNQDIPHTSFVRPSLLLGSRKEFRFGEEAGKAFAKVIAPLMVGKLKRYRAIEAQQVAGAMLWIAQQTDPLKLYENEHLFDLKG